MTSPDPSTLLTDDWCGHPHYVCRKCGYDTFDLPKLNAHPCRPFFLPDATLSADPPPAQTKPIIPLTRKKGG